MPLMKIRLELARQPGFPDGSAAHGYEFTAPLNEQATLDAAQWQAHKAECTVRRFWGAAEEEHGHLVRGRRGNWKFDYDEGEDDADDEPLFKLDRHRLQEGEYVSLTDTDGKQLTFRVVSVRPLLR